MATITFIEHGGSTHTVAAKPGLSLMEAARDNNVPGILAECGGSCSCSTCHVFFDPDVFAGLPPATEMELDLLDFAPGYDAARSRLSCQVKVTEDMDGITIHIPETQM